MAPVQMNLPQWELSKVAPPAEWFLQTSLVAARFAELSKNVNTEVRAPLKTASTKELLDVDRHYSVKKEQWAPFDQQTPVSEAEKIFQIRPGIYLASDSAASDAELFHVFNIGLVINLTGGEHRVPNFFQEQNVKYISCDMTDRPGDKYEDMLTHGIRHGSVEIDEARCYGKGILVHCSDGLNCSATVLVAWLMRADKLPLAKAVEEVSFRRGRQLQISPSFWSVLAKWERELLGMGPYMPPSFDFTHCWMDHFAGCSESNIRHALTEVGDWVRFRQASEWLLNRNGTLTEV